MNKIIIIGASVVAFIAILLSNISKEEQRRVDLFNNLVDSVESYNRFEKETFQLITDARSQANSGNLEKANLVLAMVVEAYPQLKSQENYKQAMLEFSITENRVASYRDQYNNDTRNYNRFVRSFPANIFLAIVGYEKQDYEYLDFEVDNTEARNVFNNEQAQEARLNFSWFCSCYGSRFVDSKCDRKRTVRKSQ